MASTQADTSILEQPGPLSKSIATDPLGRVGLKEMLFDPIISDLLGLKDGTAFTFDGQQQTAEAADIDAVRVLVSDGTQSFVFRGREAFKLFGKAQAVKGHVDADLPLDGSTDATDALNAAFARGPITLLVDIPAGLRIDGPVNLSSGCTLALSPSTKAKMGAGGSFRAAGDWRQDYADTPLRLSANVAMGATTIPLNTTPAGGGVASSFYSTGDRVLVRDGGRSFEARVTGLGTLSLTVSPAIPFAASMATATVTRPVILHLDADLAAETRVVPVRLADLSRIGQFDHVMIVDDQADADGSPIRVELAQVVGVEADGPGTVTLDRPVRRRFLAASNARLHLVDPVIGATLSGVNVEFVEAPGADRVDPFLQSLAVDCSFEGLRIANEDAFGSRGQLFRTERSYRSGFRKVVGLRPRYRGAGEGHGWACVQSTECFLEEARLDACNVSVLYDASTDCWHELLASSGPLAQHVGYLGHAESGCFGRLMWAERGANLVAFGGGQAGASDCYLELVKSRNPTFAHMEVVAPSSRCGVRGFEFYGGTNAFHGVDNPGSTALVGDDCYLREGDCIGITADWVILIDGGSSNGAARGMRRPLIADVNLKGCDKSFYLRRCTKPIVVDCDVINPFTPQSDTYAVRCTNASGPEVGDCTFRGVANVFACSNSPAGRFHRNTYVDLTGGAEYSNGGGNDDTMGAGNLFIGFTPSSPLPTS